ncbi:MAG: flagellar assembly protein FliH [Gammaproteobacteria bacterium]|nr:flagellar assembly protein FliH [Gammaproteobacteria bacterium]
MSNVISSKDVHKIHAWNKPEVGEDLSETHGLMSRQLDGIQKRAYDEGYTRGYQEGINKGKIEIQGQVQYLQGILMSLAQPLDMLDDVVEQDLVSLVIAVTQQLIRREIKTDPGQVIAAVRDAMGVLPLAVRHLRIYLHPDDISLVQNAMSIDAEEQSWKFMADPTLSRGGCRLLSDDSQVDASIDSRLQEVIAGIFGGDRVSDD